MTHRPLSIAVAVAAALLVSCKGTEEWLADLKNVHDDRGRLKHDVYDSGQLSFEAMSGLAVEETMTLSQAARAVATAARVAEGAEPSLLRAQAVSLIGRMTLRYPFPPKTTPYVVDDPTKSAEAAVDAVKTLDQFDRVFEIESTYLPGLKNPDRAIAEAQLAQLRLATGVDLGRRSEDWEAWWKVERPRLIANAEEGSRAPLAVLSGLRFGDPEKGSQLGSARAVLLYLGVRAALYDYAGIRAETEAAVQNAARQTAVLAIAVALRGDDPRVRAEAARAAEAIADPAFAAPLLYALPRERDPAARTALIKALALYPGRATVESLVRQMPEDIEGLKPTAEFDRSILLEARRSLVCATGEDFGLDAVAWRLWWEKSGKSRWP